MTTPTPGEHAQTALAHELFAAAQLAPGEGIEDAVSRIAAALAAAPVVQAEQLHITHGPLMRHAAALLRSRKPVLPDHESVAAELELAVEGRPTPSGEPSAEWLEVMRIATTPAQPAAPQGVAYAGPETLGVYCGIASDDVTDPTHPRYVAGFKAGHAAGKKRASNGQAPAVAYKDSTPGLHVGDSSFESWYSGYKLDPTSIKQIARDAYAAGMGDPLVTYAPTAQAAPAAGAVAGAASMPPSAFLNAAGIKADDMPGTVVRKLDAAFHEAVTFADAAPTPAAQADSQPAQVRDYPPLPPQDHYHQGRFSDPVKGWGETSMRAYVDADRAARAPADSVLEDAARATLFTTPYQRGQMAGDGKPCNNDHDPDCRWPDCICRHREARFDAARKQGGKHD